MGVGAVHGVDVLSATGDMYTRGSGVLAISRLGSRAGRHGPALSLSLSPGRAAAQHTGRLAGDIGVDGGAARRADRSSRLATPQVEQIVGVLVSTGADPSGRGRRGGGRRGARRGGGRAGGRGARM